MTTPSDSSPAEPTPAESTDDAGADTTAGNASDTAADATTATAAEALPIVKPPLKWLLAYRLLGLRLPAEHHSWLLRDAASRMFLTWRSLRTFLWGQVVVALVFVGYTVAYEQPERLYWRAVQAELLVAAVVLFSSRDALVRRVLRWHRIDKHGRPVSTVKPFARLSNLEATGVGVLVLLLVTGAGAVYGDMKKPRGVAAAPCREADPNVMELITARKTDTKAKYLTTRMIRDGDVLIVVALTDLGTPASPSPSPTAGPTPSGSPKPNVTVELWTIRGEVISRLGKDPKATTDFPAIEKPDRSLNGAISRIAECLSQTPVR